MQSRPWEYSVSVMKLWGGHISGPVLALAALVLGILSAIYANEPSVGITIVRTSAWVTGSLAGVLILVAQYDTWSQERDRYETEVAKNEKPEIKGELSIVTVHKTKGDIAAERFHSHTFFFHLHLCNQRNVETNIADITIRGSALRPPMVFFDRKVMYFQESKVLGPLEIILKYGIRTDITVMAYGYFPQDLDGDISKLEISLTDGLGCVHPIQIRKGTEFLCDFEASVASEEL